MNKNQEIAEYITSIISTLRKGTTILSDNTDLCVCSSSDSSKGLTIDDLQLTIGGSL